jgi:hypothetical protein
MSSEQPENSQTTATASQDTTTGSKRSWRKYWQRLRPSKESTTASPQPTSIAASSNATDPLDSLRPDFVPADFAATVEGPRNAPDLPPGCKVYQYVPQLVESTFAEADVDSLDTFKVSDVVLSRYRETWR